MTNKISSLNIDTGDVATLDDADDPAEETFLASFYDSGNGERHILYQKAGAKTDGKIYEFTDSKDTDRKSSQFTSARFLAMLFISPFYFQSDMCNKLTLLCHYLVKATGITNAYFPTGMAAVYVHSKSQAYLYYVNKDGSSYHLWKAVKAKSGDGKWKWTAKKVSTDSDLKSTTQVTATVIITGKDSAGNPTGKNYVAYITDGDNIETVQDDW